MYIINREIHRRVSSKVKQFLFDGGDEIKTGKEKLNKFTILANAAMYHKLQLKTEKSNNQCLRIFLFVWKKLYTFLQLRPKFIDQSLFIVSGGGDGEESHGFWSDGGGISRRQQSPQGGGYRKLTANKRLSFLAVNLLTTRRGQEFIRI